MARYNREYYERQRAERERKQVLLAQNRYEQKQLTRELQKHRAENAPKQGVRAGFVLDILKYVVLILLVYELISYATGRLTSITFDGFLSVLENAPVFPVELLSQLDFTITLDWGVFNFLRDFINLFAPVLTVLSFVGLLLYNAIAYLLYFLRWLFL